ncbi:hypothetical protein STEG23_020998, partial [Scotinomys teguina]
MNSPKGRLKSSAVMVADTARELPAVLLQCLTNAYKAVSNPSYEWQREQYFAESLRVLYDYTGQKKNSNDNIVQNGVESRMYLIINVADIMLFILQNNPDMINSTDSKFVGSIFSVISALFRDGATVILAFRSTWYFTS